MQGTPGPLRYERKLRFPGVEAEWLMMLVRRHPAQLFESYPTRYVNNLYFDTVLGSYLMYHVDGVSDRKKLRIRWYGDLEATQKEPRLEVKSKQGWLIEKRGFAIGDADLNTWLAGGLRGSLRGSGVPEAIGDLALTLRPSLLNRYRRRYYETWDHRVRVTIDSELRFFDVDPSATRREGHPDPTAVVEIKYGVDAAQEGAWIASQFPFSLDKNSKYVSGMRFLHHVP